MVWAYIGINSGDTEKVLDLLNEYYQQFKLTLVEEQIGNRRSKYTTGSKEYNNHEEYFADNGISDVPGSMTTNFYLMTDIVSAPNWCVVVFSLNLATYTLSTDNRLSKFLSKELKTNLFSHYINRYIDAFEFEFWQNGEISDYIHIISSMVIDETATYGVFTSLDQEIEEIVEYDSKRTDGNIGGEKTGQFYKHAIEETNKLLDKYGYKCGFGFDRSESDCKAFYLKGHPNDINKVLQSVARYPMSTTADGEKVVTIVTD